MRSAAVLAGALATFALAAPAARADGVKISQTLIGTDGWPVLVANYEPDGGVATPSWKRCTADSCGAVVATGNSFSPGPTEPGTIFEASTDVGGVVTTDRTKPWLGQVTNTARPTFSGDVRVGGTLAPAGGTWSGGWGDESSLIGMRACPTPAGTDCKAMSAAMMQGGDGRVVINPAYAGLYVGAIDVRVGAGVAFPAIGYLFPSDRGSPWPAPTPGQIVAAGDLAGPVPARASNPVPPAVDGNGKPEAGKSATKPTVKLRRHAQRSKVGNTKKTKLLLGTVKCAGGCTANVTAAQGKRRVTWSVKAAGSSATNISVLASRLGGKARLRVLVRVAGEMIATGWVKRR